MHLDLGFVFCRSDVFASELRFYRVKCTTPSRLVSSVYIEQLRMPSFLQNKEGGTQNELIFFYLVPSSLRFQRINHACAPAEHMGKELWLNKKTKNRT